MGQVTVLKKVSSQVTRGQARSECRLGGDPALVGSQMTDEVTVQYRKVSTSGHTRSGKVKVKSRWRSSSNWITDDR